MNVLGQCVEIRDKKILVRIEGKDFHGLKKYNEEFLLKVQGNNFNIHDI